MENTIRSIEINGALFTVDADDPLQKAVATHFAPYDTDTNGTLNHAELRTALKADAWATRDIDRYLDGYLSEQTRFVEDRTGTNAPLEPRSPVDVTLERMRGYLERRQMVLSRSHVISREEFERLPNTEYRARMAALGPVSVNAQAGSVPQDVIDEMSTYCRSHQGSDTSEFCTAATMSSSGVADSYLDIYKGKGGKSPLAPSLFSGGTVLYSVFPQVMQVDTGALNFGDPGDPLEAIVVEDEAGNRVIASAIYPHVPGDKELSDTMDLTGMPRVIPDPVYLSHAAAFIKTYEEDFNAVVPILAAAHPDLPQNGVQLLLYSHYMKEWSRISGLDGAQDAAASVAVKSPYRGDYKVQFPMTDSQSENTPWSQTSWWDRDFDRQDYGPAQLNAGLVREALDDTTVSARYLGLLKERHLDSQNGLARALLNPHDSVILCAMAYDYVLTRLEKTVLADPSTTYPSDLYPFPQDTVGARRLLSLITAKRLVDYPQTDLSEEIPIGEVSSFLCLYFITGETFGIAPELPGLKVEKISPERLTYANDVKERLTTVKGNEDVEIRFIVPE